MVKAITKRDLCPDIQKNDEVEIVPDYTYMFGENIRIKEFFNLRPGEVVVKKVKKVEGKDEYTVIKCRLEDIEKKP